MKKKKVKLKPEELEEAIEAMGDEDDDTGREGTFAFHESLDAEHEEKKARFAEEVDEKKRYGGVSSYRDGLAESLRNRLSLIYWPPGYEYITVSNKRGVALEFKTPDDRHFAKGFAPCSVIELDDNAIEVLVMEVENTIARLEEERCLIIP